nr:hypothetical protein [Tanacetum cinerariifolium]
FFIIAVQTLGSGISILLAVGTPSTGSGNLYCQWELSPSSGNALCILFPTDLWDSYMIKSLKLPKRDFVAFASRILRFVLHCVLPWKHCVLSISKILSFTVEDLAICLKKIFRFVLRTDVIVGNKMHNAFPLPVIKFPLAEELPTASEEEWRITFNPHLTFTFNSQQEMDQQYPTVAKIPVLDTGKFKQWQFWIQQYLQHEHYALWEVIEFEDSYVVPTSSSSTTTTDTTSDESGKKSGRTVTLTVEDMQKKKNDVKARTTLLLSLPGEHQLRFSKYKTARELWATILKTFGGNEATKKMKKNLLKHQYRNFKAEGLEILEQTSDLDTMSLDDLYNHLKVYESEVQKKSKLNSQNMTFISSAKHSSKNEDGNTACVPTASASVATISQDTACAYIASQSSGSQIKFEDINQIDEDDMEEMDIKWNMIFLSMRADKAPRNQDRGRRDNYRQGSKAKEQAPKALMAIDGKLKTLKKEKEGVDGKLASLLKASKDLDNLIESQRSDKIKDGLGYSVVHPPPTQLYLSPKKNLSWTGLPECADDTVTNYSRPSPTVESISGDDQNRNPSVSETVASPITPKPFIKFVKPKDS